MYGTQTRRGATAAAAAAAQQLTGIYFSGYIAHVKSTNQSIAETSLVTVYLLELCILLRIAREQHKHENTRIRRSRRRFRFRHFDRFTAAAAVSPLTGAGVGVLVGLLDEKKKSRKPHLAR